MMSSTEFNGQQDVAIVEKRTAYQGFTQVDVLRLQHRLFAGGMSPVIQRELIIKPEAVGVLIYDPVLDSVLLIEQFRVGALMEANPWQLEIVAGLVDGDDHSLEDVARREVLEEAGVTLTRIERVTTFLFSPGNSNERFTLFVGQADLSQAGGVFGLPEEGEDIRVMVISAEQAFAIMRDGRMINAPLLIALQWLMLNKKDLQHRWQNLTNC